MTAPPPTPTAPPTAQTVVGSILRSAGSHWKRLLVLTLIGALVAGAVGLLIARGGSSTATVFVAPLEASPFSPDPRGQTVTNLETEAQVVQSDEVLDKAAVALGGGVTGAQLGEALAVSVPPNAQVLSLTVKGSDDLDPQAGVDAIAASYLVVRQDRAVNTLADRREAIAAAKKEARAQLSRAADRIARTTAGSPPRQVAEQELNVASGTLAALAATEAELAGVATYPGEVLAPGSDPRPRAPIVAIAIGAVLGLMIGLAWALRIDQRERRIRQATEPVRRADLP